MIHALPCPAVNVTDDGQIIAFNQLAADFLDPLLTKNDSSRLQDAFDRKSRTALPSLLAGISLDRPSQYRALLSKQSGRQCPVLLNISRLADTSLLALLQKDIGLHCFTACERVKLLEAQYENNPAGILLVNDKMEMISFNREFIRMWNIPESILHTRNDNQCLQTVLSQVNDPDTFMARVSFLYDHPEEKSTDEITLCDGRVFYRFSCPVHYGSSYLGRVWYFLDITSTKEAEEKMLHQQKFQEAILEHIQDGIIACDAAGTISLLNRASRNMHGFVNTNTPDDQCHQRYRVFHGDGITPMEPEEMPLQKALRGEQLANEELAVITADGSHRDLRANGQAMLNREGKKIGAVVSLHDITDLNRAKAQLHYMAYHDSLTGLPNRRLFHDLLQQSIRQAARNREKIGILFLDLDNFKQVNDRFGHEAGDQLLGNLTSVLRACLRDSDILSRWGGDEFVVALPQIAEQENAELVASKICHTVRKALEEIYGECQVSTSIGIALFPNHGDIPDILIRRADMAMYSAKQQGKNRYAVAKEQAHAEK